MAVIKNFWQPLYELRSIFRKKRRYGSSVSDVSLTNLHSLLDSLAVIISHLNADISIVFKSDGLTPQSTLRPKSLIEAAKPFPPMKRESSLPCSQEPATDPYPERNKSM